MNFNKPLSGGFLFTGSRYADFGAGPEFVFDGLGNCGG